MGPLDAGIKTKMCGKQQYDLITAQNQSLRNALEEVFKRERMIEADTTSKLQAAIKDMNGTRVENEKLKLEVIDLWRKEDIYLAKISSLEGRTAENLEQTNARSEICMAKQDDAPQDELRAKVAEEIFDSEQSLIKRAKRSSDETRKDSNPTDQLALAEDTGVETTDVNWNWNTKLPIAEDSTYHFARLLATIQAAEDQCKELAKLCGVMELETIKAFSAFSEASQRLERAKAQVAVNLRASREPGEKRIEPNHVYKRYDT